MTLPCDSSIIKRESLRTKREVWNLGVKPPRLHFGQRPSGTG